MKKTKIAIIDYSVGNTQSVFNAINTLGYEVIITNQKKFIDNADIIVLPGVGAFKSCIDNIKQFGLDEILNEQVLKRGKPILGICVGMQLMATRSFENGEHYGFDWIPGDVVKFENSKDCKVPHVGWNNINLKQDKPQIFDRLVGSPHFYFDHSYHFSCSYDHHIVAKVNYGIEVTAAIAKDNIYGVQFHPEKSQVNGLKLFRGIINLIKH